MSHMSQHTKAMVISLYTTVKLQLSRKPLQSSETKVTKHSEDLLMDLLLSKKTAKRTLLLRPWVTMMLSSENLIFQLTNSLKVLLHHVKQEKSSWTLPQPLVNKLKVRKLTGSPRTLRSKTLLKLLSSKPQVRNSSTVISVTTRNSILRMRS